MKAYPHTAAQARLLRAASIAGLLALAACGTVQPVGEGGAVSAGAYLASIRSQNGLAALSADPTLQRAALQQAGYMAQTQRMSHTTRLGRDFRSRLRENNIRGAAAENVAYGQKDLGNLFQAWMNSSGHRRNMLDPRFSRYGLAYAAAEGSGRRYWALVLAR